MFNTVVLNYVQHIFTGGAKKNFRGASHPLHPLVTGLIKSIAMFTRTFAGKLYEQMVAFIPSRSFEFYQKIPFKTGQFNESGLFICHLNPNIIIQKKKRQKKIHFMDHGSITRGIKHLNVETWLLFAPLLNFQATRLVRVNLEYPILFMWVLCDCVLYIFCGIVTCSYQMLVYQVQTY